MLSFLVGLVLLFLTVQNNCEGATLKEKIDVLRLMSQGRKGGPGGGAPPKVTLCTSSSNCDPGSGCLLPSGSKRGACIQCSLAASLAGQPGVTIGGCGPGGGGGGGGGGGDGFDFYPCKGVSECIGQPGGTNGCATLANGLGKYCVPCDAVSEIPAGYIESMDGCSHGQGQNTM